MDVELVRIESLREACRKLAPPMQLPVTCRRHSIEEYGDLPAEWHLKRQFSLEDPKTSGNRVHPADCQRWRQALQQRGFCLSLADGAEVLPSWETISERLEIDITTAVSHPFSMLFPTPWVSISLNAGSEIRLGAEIAEHPDFE